MDLLCICKKNMKASALGNVCLTHHGCLRTALYVPACTSRHRHLPYTTRLASFLAAAGLGSVSQQDEDQAGVPSRLHVRNAVQPYALGRTGSARAAAWTQEEGGCRGGHW